MGSLKEFLTDPTPVLSIAQIVFGLLLTFVLSLTFARFYHRYNRGLSTSPNFPPTLILISLTACFIMMVVGNSLARAFSLAGALSIVRFRNALKETEEIAAIFLSMSIGIGNGAGFFMLTTLGVLLIMVLWFSLKSGRFGFRAPVSFLLELEPETHVDVDRELESLHEKMLVSSTLVEMASSERSGRALKIYRLKLEDPSRDKLNQFMARLSNNSTLGFKRMISNPIP